MRIRIIKSVLIFFLIMGCFASKSKAQSSKPKASKSKRLSLVETLRMLLKQNPMLARERLSISDAKADLDYAWGAFRLDLDLGLKFSRRNQPGEIQSLGSFTVDVSNRTNLRLEGSAFLQKRFRPGTVFSVGLTQWWNLQTVTSRILEGAQSEQINDVQRSDLAIQFLVRQPLLKGAWLQVNLSPIWQAEEKIQVVKNQVSRFANQYVSQAIRFYWDLVYAYQKKNIQKGALKLARKQLESTVALIQANKLAPLERFQIDQVIASRKIDLLLAENAISIATAQLRILLALPHDVSIEPTEKVTRSGRVPALSELLRRVKKENPDIKIASYQLKMIRHSLFSAKNSILPQLDLTAGFTFLGTANRSTKQAQILHPLLSSLQRLFDPRSSSFQIGVALKIPLDNRLAKARLIQAEIAIRRAELQIELLESQLLNQIQQLHSVVQRTSLRIPLVASSALWAKKKMEAEEVKYKIGKSTLFNVLRYQQDLSAARLAEVRTYIDFQKDLVLLYEKVGILLARYQISQPRY